MNQNYIDKIGQEHDGKVYEIPIGVLAENVKTDDNYQFLSKTELDTLKAKPGPTSPVNSNVVTFNAAATRTDLASGSTLSTLFGNVKKWLSDLRSGAFAEATDSLSITAPGYVADARAAKTINDKFGGLQFYENAEGKWVVGADSVPKKLGSVVDGLINGGEVVGGSSLYLAPEGETVTMHELTGADKLPEGDYLITMGFLHAGGKWQMDVGTSKEAATYPSTMIGMSGEMTVRAYVFHVDAPVKLYARWAVFGDVPAYGTAFGFHETIKLNS